VAFSLLAATGHGQQPPWVFVTSVSVGLHHDAIGHLRMHATVEGYSPGSVKRNVNFSSVSSGADLNLPWVLSTVCGMSSRLTQVTGVPPLTVMAPGVNAKLSIFTSGAESVGVPSVPPPPSRHWQVRVVERGIDDRQAAGADHLVHIGDSQHPLQLVGRYFHGSRRGG
jgi:hypothetical protein